VGKATRIQALEIWWPTSQTRQTFRDVGLNQYIDVKEFERNFTQQQTRPSKRSSNR
jgi:hypothetical protein